MRYISYAVETGQKNMDIDAQLLEEAIEKNLQEPIFRLYGWAPSCVSLGRNQDDKFLDRDFLRSKKIDVVRRLTGGRALLHDNEITYSFICPVSYLRNGGHVMSSYIEISEFLIGKFRKLGIELVFGTSKPVRTGFQYCMLVSTGADLCYNGKKLIGSAQCRKNGYILQHGSILYDCDKALLESIFGEEINTDDVITVKEINSNLIKDKIIEILSSEV